MESLWYNRSDFKTVTIRITNSMLRAEIDYMLFVTTILHGELQTKQIKGTAVATSISYVYEFTFEADEIIDFYLRKQTTVPSRLFPLFSIVIGTGTGTNFFPYSNIGLFSVNNTAESMALTKIVQTVSSDNIAITQQDGSLISSTLTQFSGLGQNFSYISRIRGTITVTGAVTNAELIVYENDNTGNGFVVALETFSTTGAETIKFLLTCDIAKSIRATSIITGQMAQINFKDIAYTKVILRNHGGICSLSGVSADGLPLIYNTGI